MSRENKILTHDLNETNSTSMYAYSPSLSTFNIEERKCKNKCDQIHRFSWSVCINPSHVNKKPETFYVIQDTPATRDDVRAWHESKMWSNDTCSQDDNIITAMGVGCELSYSELGCGK